MVGAEYQRQVRAVAAACCSVYPFLSTLGANGRKQLLFFARQIKAGLSKSRLEILLHDGSLPELDLIACRALWQLFVQLGFLTKVAVREILIPPPPVAPVVIGVVVEPESVQSTPPERPAPLDEDHRTPQKIRKTYSARAAELWGKADPIRKERLEAEAIRKKRKYLNCSRLI